ncbi:elongator complex protein 6 isoform 9 [Homo sapiens]|uniref:elongator complex protein 6 isoform 9 n=1 Tax=Homo sapiens TaxID=9606 RepID=UPI002867F713|nr:elongator complex protein 6 isoform 9 [Homo sapiens]
MPRQMGVSLYTTFSPSISKGVSLTMARERGQLVFLEGLKSAVDVVFQAQKEPHPLQFLREANAGNLKPLFEFVREALKPVDSGEARWTYPVLLVDDLSVLLSLGMGAVAVLDFIHYCRATVCWELKLRILWRRPSQPAVHRDQSFTYQYKIQDKSVSFFAKGMSPAVL